MTDLGYGAALNRLALRIAFRAIQGAGVIIVLGWLAIKLWRNCL